MKAKKLSENRRFCMFSISFLKLFPLFYFCVIASTTLLSRENCSADTHIIKLQCIHQLSSFKENCHGKAYAMWNACHLWARIITKAYNFLWKKKENSLMFNFHQTIMSLIFLSCFLFLLAAKLLSFIFALYQLYLMEIVTVWWESSFSFLASFFFFCFYFVLRRLDI